MIRSGESGSAQESRDPLRRVGNRSGESGTAQESRDPLRRGRIRSGSSRIRWDPSGGPFRCLQGRSDVYRAV